MPNPRYRCCYGPCTRNTRPNAKSLNASPNVSLVQFPSPKMELEKCKRWVSACGRSSFTIRDVSKSSWICARHFHGFQGPTPENPDPVPLIDVMSPDIIKALVKERDHTDAGVIDDALIPSSSNTLIESKTQNHSIRTLNQPLGPSCDEIEAQPTNEFVLKKEIEIHALTPQVGWATEVFENSVKFSKLKNGSAIIECTFCDDSVIIDSIGKRINFQSIFPNFVLRENKDIYELLEKLNNFNICQGNPDKDFVFLFKKKPKCKQEKTGYYCEKVQTIYSDDCCRLIPAEKKRCYMCVQYRGCLRKIRSKHNSKKVVAGVKKRLTKKCKTIESWQHPAFGCINPYGKMSWYAKPLRCLTTKKPKPQFPC